ncbi:MAG TPA: 50S ribosomal protein L6 [Bacteroidetes bacterium]|nr:50S ribosomal protein L6 [Bacteroidota bacterium]
MSRVGKVPIEIPQGVKIETRESSIKVNGPKGELSRTIDPALTIKIEDGKIYLKRPTDSRYHRSLHGLYRSLIANMVTGVSEGFQKRLEIVGVGYRAEKKGKSLVLQLGFSHPIVFFPPEGIDIVVESPTSIVVNGIDKELVGLVAAKIRSFRPPEPYKGKGIRYAGEYVRKKAGKSGAYFEDTMMVQEG